MDYNSILQDTNFWVALSFIIFVFAVWNQGKKAITGILDKEIAEIRQELEGAENLRIEAQELLAQYERKQKDSMTEAQNMIDDAKKQAIEIQKNISNETENMIASRQALLQERIRIMEENAVLDLRDKVTTIATAAVVDILNARLDGKQQNALIENSIDAVSTRIRAVRS